MALAPYCSMISTTQVSARNRWFPTNLPTEFLKSDHILPSPIPLPLSIVTWWQQLEQFCVTVVCQHNLRNIQGGIHDNLGPRVGETSVQNLITIHCNGPLLRKKNWPTISRMIKPLGKIQEIYGYSTLPLSRIENQVHPKFLP